MQVIISPEPTATRQTCSGAFAGAAPEFSGAAYLPFYLNHIYKYVDPGNTTLETLDQGGLFDFGSNVRAYAITEIRSLLVGNIVVVVEDRDGTHSIQVFSGPGTYAAFTDPIIVLPSQRVKVSTVGSGWVDLYVRSAAVF